MRAAMIKSCFVKFFASAAAIFFLLETSATWACEASRKICEERFAQLVRYRAQAIEKAFGDLSATLPEEIGIKLVSSRDPQAALIEANQYYDRQHDTLIFPRHILNARMPSPMSAATEYWPYYEDERARLEVPVIETVDNALWHAYMQRAAKANDLSWPHEDCRSTDMGKRLPCEMLVNGVAEHIKTAHGPIFNTNRIEEIWPEDFSDFRREVMGSDDKAYREVQRYGGIMLVRPLISEFGVPRVLAYVARTPFRIENDNLRASAHRYQERAREALVW